MISRLATLVLVSAGVSAWAQPPGTLVCSSDDGRRTMCQADTRNGVSFIRQLGDVRCVEGYGWGFNEQGVWVDHGCRAEFRVASEPPRNFERQTRLESGTVIPVRVDESITTERADGRIFTGSIMEDVRGRNGRVGIPAGSGVELIVRAARDGDLILDVESVIVQGQRYAIDVDAERVESRRGGTSRRTGEFAAAAPRLERLWEPSRAVEKARRSELVPERLQEQL